MDNIISFNSLNLHDCKIHALGFDKEKNELLLDVDFIKQWIEENNSFYKLILVPSTFVFKNVWNIYMDIEMDDELIINDISRNNPTSPKNIHYLDKSSIEYDWTIDLLQGEISFKSIGLTLYERGKQIVKSDVGLNLHERNGISFSNEGNIYYIE